MDYLKTIQEQDYDALLQNIKQTAITTVGANHQEFKLAGALLLIIGAYFGGKLTANKLLETSLDKLNNSDHFKKELNKNVLVSQLRLAKFSKIIKTIIIFMLVVAIATGVALKLTNILPNPDPLHTMFAACGAVLLLLVLLITKAIFKRQYAKNSAALNNMYQQEQLEVKKVMDLLGSSILGKLKSKLEAVELEKQSAKFNQECTLYSCKEQTRIYREAVATFEEIITEIAGCKWCERCSSQVEEVKYNVDAFIVNYKLNTTPMPLDSMKQMFNQLLQIYTKKRKELEATCTDNCCSIFYGALRPISTKFFGKLEEYEKRLNAVKN